MCSIIPSLRPLSSAYPGPGHGSAGIGAVLHRSPSPSNIIQLFLGDARNLSI